jgi:cellulose synthase/poly-beta-1,6-N-acetylglucosamine synthase-like glycosyltransferase
MYILVDIIGFLYLLATFSLALYGLNNLVTTILFLKMRKEPSNQTPGQPRIWPRVTIQLPIYNEKYTVERLLGAVTRLDYPSDRLEIQVLDDSTDDTVQLVDRLVEQYAAQGHAIRLIRRAQRVGYKAGALAAGLQSASGELIGIFDADFLPGPDWLKRTVPPFQDPKLGCLQTRWGHVNRRYNSLTFAEALGVDGHFIVEQTVRSGKDFFLNFNGTAGLWRRACIEDAGGWQSDTVTEDLDLSYRAQLCGWKIDYRPDVIVPAELPSDVEAYKKQQFRWAKGSSQVVRKILPRIFEQPELPWQVRVMAALHLTGYFVHPLMLSLLLLTLPVGLFLPGIFKVFPVSVIAGLGSPLLYLMSSAPQTPPIGERLRALPLLVITGFGISLSTSIAVLQGLISDGGVFSRTPKLNLGNAHGRIRTVAEGYRPKVSSVVWAEILLGVYALLTIFLLQPYVGWGVVPWMIIYMTGFFYIAGFNLLQHGSNQNAV